MKNIKLEMDSESFREVMTEVLKEQLSDISAQKAEKPRLPKYLTRSQVAEVIGIHPNTVTLWGKSGKISRDKKISHWLPVAYHLFCGDGENTQHINQAIDLFHKMT